MTELVTIDRAELDALQADRARLRALEEDTADIAAIQAARRDPGPRLPLAAFNRILDGASPVAVWREHRGLSGAELARQVGISRAFLSQIEAGSRSAALHTMRKLATALGVAIDDLVNA